MKVCNNIGVSHVFNIPIRGSIRTFKICFKSFSNRPAPKLLDFYFFNNGALDGHFKYKLTNEEENLIIRKSHLLFRQIITGQQYYNLTIIPLKHSIDRLGTEVAVYRINYNMHGHRLSQIS